MLQRQTTYTAWRHQFALLWGSEMPAVYGEAWRRSHKCSKRAEAGRYVRVASSQSLQASIGRRVFQVLEESKARWSVAFIYLQIPIKYTSSLLKKLIVHVHSAFQMWPRTTGACSDIRAHIRFQLRILDIHSSRSFRWTYIQQGHWQRYLTILIAIVQRQNETRKFLERCHWIGHKINVFVKKFERDLR